MQTILLICDDEARRAELHRQLLPDFEVYAVSHKRAASLRRKMGRKKVIVVEEEDWGASKKISIHPLTGQEGGKLSRLIGSIVEVVRVGCLVQLFGIRVIWNVWLGRLRAIFSRRLFQLMS